MIEGNYIEIKNKIIHKKPGSPLFHYTSMQGLLGIFGDRDNSKKNVKYYLWATNIFYLNDAAEFIYAINLTKEILNNLNNSNVKQKINSRLQSIEEWTKSIYIISFSKNGDLLSQWRGYCPSGNGYSIGFTSEQIERSRRDTGFSLVECIYEKDEQKRLIRGLINETLKESNSPDYFNQEFVQYIAPILKDPSFKQEEEWRLISGPKPYDRHVKYRKGRSMIIPYINFELKKDLGRRLISQIIVGPNPHKDLSKRSIKNLLTSKNIICSEPKAVINSEIPFRGSP